MYKNIFSRYLYTIKNNNIIKIMSKVITRSVHDKLDFFVHQQENKTNPTINYNGNLNNNVQEKKKTVKKNTDGLMERMDTKVIISEDNRELLRD